MENNPRLTRRDFLRLAADSLLVLAGLLGLGGLARFFSYRSAPEEPQEYNLGPVSAFPPGSRTLRPEIPAVILNRDGEVVAYSLVCTHLGCTVELDSEGYACPCHGSRYGSDGQVLSGPAREPLPTLQVEVREGNLVVFALS